MTMSMPTPADQSLLPEPSRAERGFARAAFWLYIATLAWAPFPLGSNRPWSWSVLILLVALCWLLWGAGTWLVPQQNWKALRRFTVPALLGGATLLWALVQISPWVPAGWAHPVWSLASSEFHRPVAATISIDPWATATEALKLATYAAALWLTFLMARRAEDANRLLLALIAIGAAYALYGIVLGLLGMSQFELFYSGPVVRSGGLAATFVNKNSYATYAGMASIAAVVRLVTLAGANVVATRGLKPWLLSALHFLFGRGIGALVALLLCFSTLVASASRAGFAATLCGLAAVSVVAALVSGRRAAFRWSLGGGIALFALVVVLIAMSGDTLAERLNQLVDAGGPDAMRLALWDAAGRMISDSPFLGLGLGTFRDAYPLYANQVLPFMMDRAHSDYLEFAAGLGLPAAIAWWLAWALLALQCLRGVFARRRNRQYALLAFGASVLVAVHSAFDFSLQMPAVAFTYATILGLGLAQSLPTRSAS